MQRRCHHNNDQAEGAKEDKKEARLATVGSTESCAPITFLNQNRGRVQLAERLKKIRSIGIRGPQYNILQELITDAMKRDHQETGQRLA